MNPNTPQNTPNPAVNEQNPTYGPLGDTRWIFDLQQAFEKGSIGGITCANGRCQVSGGSGASGSGGSLSNALGQNASAVEQLLGNSGITSISRDQSGIYTVQTNDGHTYQSNALQGALSQVSGLTLNLPAYGQVFGNQQSQEGQQGGTQASGQSQSQSQPPASALSQQSQSNAAGTGYGSDQGQSQGDTTYAPGQAGPTEGGSYGQGTTPR